MIRWLLLLAALIAGPARAEWWEARTDHFIVYSESSQKDAKEYAERLERYDSALRSLQTIKPDPRLSDSRKVTIFRFGNTDDMAIMAGAPGSGIGGFYIPRATGPVAFAPARGKIGEDNLLDAETVLLHEYAHHFMFRHFSAAYPSWYVEGLAEAYSTIDFRKDGTFHLGNPPQARAEALFGENALNYSVTRMLLTSQRPDFEDVFGRYTYGWLLVHYMTFEPSRAGQMTKYLKLINDGSEQAEAARQAFGDLGKLERDVNRYKTRQLPGAIVKPAQMANPEVAMRKLGPDEEAIIRVRMRSKRGVGPKEARDAYSDARAIGARFPNSYAVQLALSEAAFDAKHYDEAERAADAALAARPDDAEALLYKAQAYMGRGKADPKNYATARTWLAKAQQADPDHPAPYIYNYLTYSKAKVAAPESALIGLERAYTLAPYDADLRLVLSRQLLAEKKGSLARILLIPLASSPHESKRAKEFNEIVDLIDANKVDEAHAKLAASLDKAEKDAEKEDS